MDGISSRFCLAERAGWEQDQGAPSALNQRGSHSRSPRPPSLRSSLRCAATAPCRSRSHQRQLLPISRGVWPEAPATARLSPPTETERPGLSSSQPKTASQTPVFMELHDLLWSGRDLAHHVFSCRARWPDGRDAGISNPNGKAHLGPQAMEACLPPGAPPAPRARQLRPKRLCDRLLLPKRTSESESL